MLGQRTRPDRATARQILKLAWPLILSNSFWVLQISLDRIFLGHSSSDAVGASMAASLLLWVPLALLQGTASYATTFVAQYTGAGQPERVGAAVWQSLRFSIVAGLAFLLFMPVAEWIIALGGHGQEIQLLEVAYFHCLCWSALPALVVASVTSFFTGRGDSRTALVISLVGLAVNMVLAYCWIFGKYGFPAWGIVGAGLATVVGTLCSAVLGLVLLFRPAYRAKYALLSARGWDPELFGRLMRFGLPNGMFVALDTLSFTLFLWYVGRMGEAQLVATTIAWTLNLIVYFPAMGLAQAVGVLVGQHLGENRPDQAERTAWTGLVIGEVFTVVVGLIYLLCPAMLTALFHGQGAAGHWDEITTLVPVLLRFVVVYMLFDCANLVFSFALRGAGDTRFVVVVAVALAWPVMVAPTIAAWYLKWGLYWAWAFASLYIMSLAVVFCRRFLRGRWRSMRVIEEKTRVPEVKDQSADVGERGALAPRF